MTVLPEPHTGYPGAWFIGVIWCKCLSVRWWWSFPAAGRTSTTTLRSICVWTAPSPASVCSPELWAVQRPSWLWPQRLHFRWLVKWEESCGVLKSQYVTHMHQTLEMKHMRHICGKRDWFWLLKLSIAKASDDCWDWLLSRHLCWEKVHRGPCGKLEPENEQVGIYKTLRGACASVFLLPCKFFFFLKVVL